MTPHIRRCCSIGIGPFLHADVSQCACVQPCTSCRPFVITNKKKGVVAELFDAVAKHCF